jgi:TonB family protein
MNFRKNRSLWISLILHIAVFVGLFLATIIEAFKPKEEAHVFVMVDPPSDSPQVNQAQSQALPEPELTLPNLTELTAVPDLPKPAPTPPKPTPVTPAPVTPAPVKPAPAKPAPAMSMEDFRKLHGTPEPRIRNTPQPSRPAANPQIDSSRIQQQLNQILKNQPSREASTRSMSQQDMNDLLAYNQQLSSRLTRAWGKPTNLSGVRLEATVIFDVSPSGQITNARLNPSSGNRAFDQSVLAAFSKVGNAGPTPTGQQHTFTKTFRMTD